jgi:hypothetical protein
MLKSRNANVEPTLNGWKFKLVEGGPSGYRYAQLDDYSALARRRFIWRERATLSLRCRLSDSALPGTWGFGFWNDPFSFALGLEGMGQRLPVLPNCAWFFYSSPENHLSFAGHKPGNGFLAQTFSAPRFPSLLLAPGLFGTPLLLVKPISRLLRANLAAKLISEAAKRLEVDATQWHLYQLQWGKGRVEFAVDGEAVFITETSPKGPLGLVIWIDNQFAAWKPDGSLGLGTLPNPPAWMEIERLDISQ